jgi:hypothetical protein
MAARFLAESSRRASTSRKQDLVISMGLAAS